MLIFVLKTIMKNHGREGSWCSLSTEFQIALESLGNVASTVEIIVFYGQQEAEPSGVLRACEPLGWKTQRRRMATAVLLCVLEPEKESMCRRNA